MKIYGIRDRMIDWFIQPPFFANSDEAAKSGLSQTINGDSKHAVVQAPHHFELWRLGEVNETTGDLKPDREFLADCSSLLRPRVRLPAEERGRDPGSPNPPGTRQDPPGGTSVTT